MFIIRLLVLKVTDKVSSLLVFSSVSLDVAVPCLLNITKLSYPKVKALNLEGSVVGLKYGSTSC